MAVIVMTSAAGAPGTTTAALSMALSWPRRCLFVEADPAGSSLVPGWLGGAYDGSRSLLNVVLGVSNGLSATDLIGLQQVSAPEPFTTSQTTFLLGWLTPAQAASAAGMWGHLGAAFESLDDAEIDVIVDAGRATQGSWPVDLLGHADQVVMVCRGTHVSAVRTAPTVTALRDLLTATGAADKLGVLVVGERDASATEIAKSLSVRLAARLPEDAPAARVLSDGWPGTLGGPSASNPKKLLRSKLWGQAQGAGQELFKAAQARRAVIHDSEESR